MSFLTQPPPPQSVIFSGSPPTVSITISPHSELTWSQTVNLSPYWGSGLKSTTSTTEVTLASTTVTIPNMGTNIVNLSYWLYAASDSTLSTSKFYVDSTLVASRSATSSGASTAGTLYVTPGTHTLYLKGYSYNSANPLYARLIVDIPRQYSVNGTTQYGSKIYAITNNSTVYNSNNGFYDITKDSSGNWSTSIYAMMNNPGASSSFTVKYSGWNNVPVSLSLQKDQPFTTRLSLNSIYVQYPTITFSSASSASFSVTSNPTYYAGWLPYTTGNSYTFYINGDYVYNSITPSFSSKQSLYIPVSGLLVVYQNTGSAKSIVIDGGTQTVNSGTIMKFVSGSYFYVQDYNCYVAVLNPPIVIW
ncbi:MAG: hypothetical protein QXZ17_05605 [Nitrososphaerota archaeon]